MINHKKEFPVSWVSAVLIFLLVLFYGILDSITAYLMMSAHGVLIESNLLIRQIYPSYGLMGIFIMKLVFIIVILCVGVKILKTPISEVWLGFFVYGGILGTILNIGAT